MRLTQRMPLPIGLNRNCCKRIFPPITRKISPPPLPIGQIGFVVNMSWLSMKLRQRLKRDRLKLES